MKIDLTVKVRKPVWYKAWYKVRGLREVLVALNQITKRASLP